jgi:hypothetical protein
LGFADVLRQGEFASHKALKKPLTRR